MEDSSDIQTDYFVLSKVWLKRQIHFISQDCAQAVVYHSLYVLFRQKTKALTPKNVITLWQLHSNSTLIKLFKLVKKLHYICVPGVQNVLRLGTSDLSSLQLAAIHEMRKSIMHLILFSVDQDSVSQWHHRDYKHCSNLLPTLLQYPYMQWLLLTVSTVSVSISRTQLHMHEPPFSDLNTLPSHRSAALNQWNIFIYSSLVLFSLDSWPTAQYLWYLRDESPVS